MKQIDVSELWGEMFSNVGKTGNAGASRPAKAPDALGGGSGETDHRSVDRASSEGQQGAETRLAGPLKSAAETEDGPSRAKPCGPGSPEGGWASANQAGGTTARSGSAAKPEAPAEGAFALAQPHEGLRTEPTDSRMAGAAKKQKKRGSETAPVSGDLGASSPVYRDVRSGERSEIAEPSVPLAPSMLSARDAGQHATASMVKKKLKSGKNEKFDESTYKILCTLLRHGAMIKVALYMNALNPAGYESDSAYNSFSRTLNNLEKKKLVIYKDIRDCATKKKKTSRNQKAEQYVTKKDKKKPGTLHLVRLTAKGARYLDDHGVTDIFGNRPLAYRATKSKIPTSWRHATIVSMHVSSIMHEYDYVTDHELGKVCRASSVKYPDMLIRRKNTTGPWKSIEVEHLEKEGQWWTRQCQMLAYAHDTGYRLAGRWDIDGCEVVTTTKKQSPTVSEIGEGVSAFAVTPGEISVHVYNLDPYMNVVSVTPLKAIVNPVWGVDKIKTKELGPYGHEYIQKLNKAYAERAHSRKRGVDVKEPKDDVYLTTLLFGDFNLAVFAEPPRGSEHCWHFANITYRGEPVRSETPLGHYFAIDDKLKVAAIRACRWGDGGAIPDVPKVVAAMKKQNSLGMFAKLSEAVRWRRADGRSFDELVKAANEEYEGDDEDEDDDY